MTNAYRLHLEVSGLVQGLGFRPFVYRLARELELAGWVLNDGHGVAIEIEGPLDALATFQRRLRSEAPQHATLESVAVSPAEVQGDYGFLIRASHETGQRDAPVPPELTLCVDCARELADPQDRRYRYPFINCTSCGPRYSIMHGIPYDRETTTMSSFIMCGRCQAEYDDPENRRFHAQPNACPRCGPLIWLEDASGRTTARRDAAVELAAQQLASGMVLAVKGLGGFHLVVDATADSAVAGLRERKHRWEKPLALMVLDTEAAQQIVELNPSDLAELSGPAAPIVVADAKLPRVVADAVAPGLARLGVMVAYTPLHRLLLERFGGPLVATSGNLSEEPICVDNDEARGRLGSIADGMLMHDRVIERPLDDSVSAGGLSFPIPLRRARGHAPLTFPLARPMPALLAFGGHQKNTIALALGERIVVSQHVGDLDSELSLSSHRRVVADTLALYGTNVVGVVHDAHPDYGSTRTAEQFAERFSIPRYAVQHHHAHFASCLLESGWLAGEDVLGLVWDGAGLGSDGALWGGEALRGNAQRAVRVAHPLAFALPGGGIAARQPRRSALGLLRGLGWNSDRWGSTPSGQSFANAELALLEQMMNQDLQSPRTTSVGRLFDGVASLLGLAQQSSYEGQAAVYLEQLAAREQGKTGHYPVAWLDRGVEPAPTDAGLAACRREPFTDVLVEDAPQKRVWDWRASLEPLLADRAGGVESTVIAARFHSTLVEYARQTAREAGCPRVVLTGGCLQNRLLAGSLEAALRADGFEVATHRRVPPNDGGLSLGQLAVAGHQLAQGSVTAASTPE